MSPYSIAERKSSLNSSRCSCTHARPSQISSSAATVANQSSRACGLGEVERREQRRRRDLLDREAELALDRGERGAEGLLDVLGQRTDVARSGRREDAPGHPTAVLPRRRRGRVAVRRAAHHVEEQLRVLDGRRERPLGRVVHPRGDRPASDQPVGRLEAGQAAERRRRSDRAAAVASGGDRRQAGGEGRGRAAGGAARRPVEAPRVARRPEQLAVGIPLERELGQVGAADRDRARRHQAFDGDLAPFGGRPVEHRARGVARELAGHIGVVLDQQRQAGERALGAALVELLGLRERLLRPDGSVTAFSAGFSRSIRSIDSRTSSTAERRRSRTAWASCASI